MTVPAAIGAALAIIKTHERRFKLTTTAYDSQELSLSYTYAMPFAGFNEQEPITDDTWHVLAVARKMSGP